MRCAAAAGQDHVLRLRAQLGQHSEGVGTAQGDAFHDGAHKLGLAVAQGQAQEEAARPGIHVGRAFAREVGQEEQPVRAGATPSARAVMRRRRRHP
ncbi:MAG: hypothetical protein R2854_17190 [Caldilineaceae bacterium]